MYSYLIGTVVEMNIDHIVVENSGIGYLIYVNNPYEYTRGKEIKIFLYQQVKEDALLLYGFKTSEEKEMFLKLILVARGHHRRNDRHCQQHCGWNSDHEYCRKCGGDGGRQDL